MRRRFRLRLAILLLVPVLVALTQLALGSRQLEEAVCLECGSLGMRTRHSVLAVTHFDTMRWEETECSRFVREQLGIHCAKHDGYLVYPRDSQEVCILGTGYARGFAKLWNKQVTLHIRRLLEKEGRQLVLGFCRFGLRPFRWEKHQGTRTFGRLLPRYLEMAQRESEEMDYSRWLGNAVLPWEESARLLREIGRD